MAILHNGNSIFSLLNLSHSSEAIFLIHSADPHSLPVVITIFRGSVRQTDSFQIFENFTKQISIYNSDRYCRDCGSGRGDHWWYTCFLLLLLSENACKIGLWLTTANLLISFLWWFNHTTNSAAILAKIGKRKFRLRNIRFNISPVELKLKFNSRRTFWFLQTCLNYYGQKTPMQVLNTLEVKIYFQIRYRIKAGFLSYVYLFICYDSLWWIICQNEKLKKLLFSRSNCTLRPSVSGKSFTYEIFL